MFAASGGCHHLVYFLHPLGFPCRPLKRVCNLISSQKRNREGNTSLTPPSNIADPQRAFRNKTAGTKHIHTHTHIIFRSYLGCLATPGSSWILGLRGPRLSTPLAKTARHGFGLSPAGTPDRVVGVAQFFLLVGRFSPRIRFRTACGAD